MTRRSSLILSAALACGLSVVGCNNGADHAHDGKGAHSHGDNAEKKADHHDHHADKKAPASQPASSQPATKEAAATLGKGEDPKDRDQIDKDGVVRRGTELASAKATPVADCMSKSSDLAGKEVTVSGKVSQVCAKKGCWFVIEDEKDASKTIRITSKGYKFFVPRDAVGKKAVIKGDLSVKEMSVAEAQHMEDDRAAATGEKAKKVTEGSKELRIAAVALELR